MFWVLCPWSERPHLLGWICSGRRDCVSDQGKIVVERIITMPGEWRRTGPREDWYRTSPVHSLLSQYCISCGYKTRCPVAPLVDWAGWHSCPQGMTRKWKKESNIQFTPRSDFHWYNLAIKFTFIQLLLFSKTLSWILWVRHKEEWIMAPAFKDSFNNRRDRHIFYTTEYNYNKKQIVVSAIMR